MAGLVTSTRISPAAKAVSSGLLRVGAVGSADLDGPVDEPLEEVRLVVAVAPGDARLPVGEQLRGQFAPLRHGAAGFFALRR